MRAAERGGVHDRRVLDALRAVDRADFVPDGATGSAYSDRPVPIPHGQTTSQPSLIASMVEALELEGDERVLEIGTGYGFQTALLAELAAEVFSIDRYPRLVEDAQRNLRDAGYDGPTLEAGDGYEGMPEHAPFDAIIVSATAPDVPSSLVHQLEEGGRLVIPVKRGLGESVVVYRRQGDELVEERDLARVRFVPLRDGVAEG